jgi:hypothetical protein
MAVAAEGRGEIGAEPVAAGVALRINALHGEAGQVLHLFSLSGRKAQAGSWCERVAPRLNKLLSSPYGPKALAEKVPGSFPKTCDWMNAMAGIVPRVGCGVKRKGYKILW